MSHEWSLARAFVGVGRSGRLHSSFVVSILAVLIGVAFLVLTLGVYDSYAGKLETIAFTVYPHVLVIDAQSLEGQSEGEEGEPAAGDDAAAGGEIPAAFEDQQLRCDRICRGETVLNPEAWTSEAGGIRVSLERVEELRRLLDGDGRHVAVAPVVLEEAELGLRSLSAHAGSARRRVDPASARPVRVLGIDPSSPTPVPRVDLVLDEQQLALLRERPGAVFLSAPLWREALGDNAPQAGGVLVGRLGEIPGELVLGGRFELGFHALAHNLLITSEQTARSLLGLEETVSYVGIALEDPYRSRAFVEQVDGRLEEAGFQATEWTRIAGGDFESIRLFRWILFLVLGLSFLITAFGIRNALAILTLERRRQIGVLRALGLRNRSIRIIFLLIACGIGAAGAMPGLLIGSWLGVRFGAWLDHELAGILPIRGIEMAWQPAALGQVLLLVMLVCALTSAVSVGRALELDPVSCLREE